MTNLLSSIPTTNAESSLVLAEAMGLFQALDNLIRSHFNSAHNDWQSSLSEHQKTLEKDVSESTGKLLLRLAEIAPMEKDTRHICKYVYARLQTYIDILTPNVTTISDETVARLKTCTKLCWSRFG